MTQQELKEELTKAFSEEFDKLPIMPMEQELEMARKSKEECFKQMSEMKQTSPFNN